MPAYPGKIISKPPNYTHYFCRIIQSPTADCWNLANNEDNILIETLIKDRNTVMKKGLWYENAQFCRGR